MLQPLRCARRPIAVRVSRLLELSSYSTSNRKGGQPVGPSAPPSGPPNPLRVTIPTDDLGLPVTPLPPPIASIPVKKIDTALLNRLHDLAAFNPPQGEEAEKLAHDLGELIGLMDLVAPVKVDDVPGLLSEGMEVAFNAETAEKRSAAAEEAHGRELLTYATRRVGNFYGFRREGGDPTSSGKGVNKSE